jgi:hypothetical protein
MNNTRRQVRGGLYNRTRRLHGGGAEEFRDPAILKIRSTEDMIEILQRRGHGAGFFKKGREVYVWNKMEKNYHYTLTEPAGKNFAKGFRPALSPAAMLAAGVFEGKYLNDCVLEFPREWFIAAIRRGKLSPGEADVKVNRFGVDSRQPLSVWRRNGWLPGTGRKSTAQHPALSDPKSNPDERGWFQWYCRYWMGRRLHELDEIQIKRWKAFSRHAGQIHANCKPRDLSCRPRQRQGLLQWAYSPYI